MTAREIHGKRRRILRSISNSYITSLFVLSAGAFAFRASSNMFYTNLPLVAREVFNFSNTAVGTLAGIAALAGFISITFVNTKLQSTWRRRLFIAGAFIYSAIFSFIPLEGYFGIWFLSIMAGFFIQLIPTNLANASGIIGKASVRERAITLYTVSLSASLVVGPFINSEILTHVSISYSYAAFAAFPICAALLTPLFPFPKESSTVAETDRLDTRKKVDQSSSLGSFRQTWRNQGFQAALFINAMYSVPFAALVSFGGLFSREYFHVSNSSVQMYFVIFFAVSFLFRLLLLFSKTMNIRAIMVVSISLTLVGIMLLIVASNPFFYAVALAVLGIPHGLTFPSSLIVILRNSDESRRNILNSYFASSYALINVLTPLLIGLIADLIGLRFAFGALFISIAVFAYLIFRKWSNI